MTPIAQTNLQLYTQLFQEGFRQEDLDYIHQAYNLGVRLFTCLYRPNGKEHLAHAVGTASILCSLHLRLPLITAGLLHAAYKHGAFPNGQKGPTDQNRKTIRDLLGEEVEELLFKYYSFLWETHNLGLIQESISDLFEVDRDVLLIRLANDLEDKMDVGVLFCQDAQGRQRSIRQNGPIRITLARKLGYPQLADQLAAANDDILHSTRPPILRKGNGGRSDFFVIPLSYRRRFGGWLSQIRPWLKIRRKVRLF